MTSVKATVEMVYYIQRNTNFSDNDPPAVRTDTFESA